MLSNRFEQQLPTQEQNKPKPRPTRDYAPKNKRSKVTSSVQMLLLFIVLLIILYVIFPKQPSRANDPSMYYGLVISEVMSANISAVPDENGLFSDWLEIYNGTGKDLNLKDVALTTRIDQIFFYFPSYLLKADGRIVVFASGTHQMDPEKPFHANFKLSASGRNHIFLYDPNMNLIDTVYTPTLTANCSYALMNIDTNGEKRYEDTTIYSPGYENSEAGFNAYRATNSIGSSMMANMDNSPLIINEVCPEPAIGIPDEDNEIVKWLELRNTSNKTISLSGYYLSDNDRKPLKWGFPESASIPANGYYLVFCSSKDKLQKNGIPHTNFGISNKQETLVLSDSTGRFVDRVSLQNVPVDYSFGRNSKGEWELFPISSQGYSNDRDGEGKADAMIRAFNPTGIYISEVMASNSATILGSSSAKSDYVELYNSSSNKVDLSYFGISDNIKRPRKWQFPQGATIESGEYIVIYLDKCASLSTFREFHTNFGLRRSGGETITFCDPNGRILDRIPLPLIPTDHSYGRTIGSSGFLYYDAPTPGTANGLGYFGQAKNPSFNIPGGEYKGSALVSINVPDNTTVYYTLDGSIPTETASKYNSGDVLDFSQVTVLRARAFDQSGDLQPSEVITQTYLMNLYHTLPIVSVIADPNELWNPVNGLLTVGDTIDKSQGIPFKNAIYRDFGKIDRPGYVEMYDIKGNLVFSQNMEFCLSGSFSLDMPQKSFKFRSKAKYGSKYFSAQLFDDLPFTEYKGFVLRNSGNDCVWTRFNDSFQQHLIDCFNKVTQRPSTVLHEAWRPVVVYLNGEYWGHYNMGERVDRYFVAQHEGLDLSRADQMDLLQANFKPRVDSSNKEYVDMIEKVATLSPGKDENDLQYILDRVDVDNYFDYMAFEMFFGNSDNGNIRYYKLKSPGSKWRWIIYDLDYGLFRSGFDSPTSYLKETGAGQQKIDNTLIRKLLENEDMKDKFLTRLGEVFQVFTTEFMTREFNSMAATLEPEMPIHFARWAGENDKAINVDSPLTPEGALRYWHTRLDYTRNVLKKRPTYFYEMVQERFQLTDEQMRSYFGAKPPMPDDALYTEGKKWS